MNSSSGTPSISSSPSGHTLFGSGLLPPGVALPDKTDPDRLGVHRIVGRITRDAAGTVLLGVDGDGAPATIRLMPAGLADAPDVRSRMTEEVGRLARVQSLCTAAHRGADVRADQPWLAAAYVPGRNLAEHVAEHGPLTGGMLTALAAGLAESLAAAHAVGAKHLALDPTKVVLSPEGPKVVDFGIARAVGKPTAVSRWAAPEQSGSGDTKAPTVTGYADVFTWGALVRFAATGWEPSGIATGDPELGNVPPHLSPLVRRSLVTDPGQRPTALQLLQELTEGQGDPAASVSALLTAEWVGVIAPEPRRVSRARGPVLLAGVAIVLIVALLGGWAVIRPGAGPDPAGTAGDQDQDAETEEEPSGPTVAEDPEDVESVVAEAVELALGASSFTTYEHFVSNAGGDFTPTHYLYTEEPRPAMTRASYLGFTGFGVLALGSGLDEFVHFHEAPEGPDGAITREYYLDPGPRSGRLEEPREEWEALLHTVEGVLAEDAQVSYTGRSTFGDEFIPQELLGDEDPLQRGGHHYAGTFVHDFHRFPTLDGGEVDFDLWVSDAGHPVRLVLSGEAENDFTGISGDPLTYTQKMDFFRFDQPVEIELPEESEIHPERP